MRTAPASDKKMSKESSPALQSKLIPASEVKETITPVSHPIGLTELTASLEALNTEVDKRSTVVHCTQTSSSSGANKIPGSPDTRDQKKTSPAPIHWPKRYALDMWLEVEVGPRLFVPPEDCRSGKSNGSTSDSNRSASSNGGRKKKDKFSSKIHIPEFVGKKGHSSDVTEAFRQWARCITYYRDYYKDSYLMPLLVSSLMGDASDVFDWIISLNPGNTQDLTTLLQMLREHYCGSLTFREQRNTIENLCQRPQEAAIDFLIRVGTSVSNLGKDSKDELMEKELQSLQYEVSLNGVQEEIRHVLDSEVAKNGGKLTPQQMYEAVKKYETYVACNKRLEGKVASLSTS